MMAETSNKKTNPYTRNNKMSFIQWLLIRTNHMKRQYDLIWFIIWCLAFIFVQIIALQDPWFPLGNILGFLIAGFPIASKIKTYYHHKPHFKRTGQPDMYGKEIYEGDVLKVHYKGIDGTTQCFTWRVVVSSAGILVRCKNAWTAPLRKHLAFNSLDFTEVEIVS